MQKKELKRFIPNGWYPPLLWRLALKNAEKSRASTPMANLILAIVSKIYYWLKFCIVKYHTIDNHKFLMKSNLKMEDIVMNYHLLKEYEPETTQLIKDKVSEGDVCVDIGASIGYFTLQLARETGKNGKVVAIEPTDFQQEHLRKNIEKNGYKNIVKQIQCGAWDKDEVIRMPLNAPAYVQTELRCRPVDDILEELNIREVDFIKIDADGPEPNILKGLERTIKRSNNLKMIIEFYPEYIKNAGLNPDDMLVFLDKYFDYKKLSDYTDDYWNLYCVRK